LFTTSDALGAYALYGVGGDDEVTASNQCAGFPTELRTRTYQWELRQSGGSMVEASGPGYPLYGEPQVDRVLFKVDPEGLGSVLLEKLSATTELRLIGEFPLFPTSSGLSGPVDGALELRENGSSQWCRWPMLTFTR
jgi:hypothetical protein